MLNVISLSGGGRRAIKRAYGAKKSMNKQRACAPRHIRAYVLSRLRALAASAAYFAHWHIAVYFAHVFFSRARTRMLALSRSSLRAQRKAAPSAAAAAVVAAAWRRGSSNGVA